MKKFTAVALLVAMLLACLSPCLAAEEDPPVYVCFGDSISQGWIENESNHPEYSKETGSYTALFASYLKTTRTNYARPGMQTSDILYMLDDEFKAQVDSREITIDPWYRDEYPPNDGTKLEDIITNVTNADYISICVGSCDYVAYPIDLYNQRIAGVSDATAARAKVEAAFKAGTLDADTYAALKELLKADGETAGVYAQLVQDMLQGYDDYATYYPKIVARLRELNPNATIICLGTYLPGGTFEALVETEDNGAVVKTLNRLLDEANLLCKEIAVTYHCYYVDTMGIESDWHPTIEGHKQICERMISVLEGDDTYAGGVVYDEEKTTYQNKIVQWFNSIFGENNFFTRMFSMIEKLTIFKILLNRS